MIAFARLLALVAVAFAAAADAPPSSQPPSAGSAAAPVGDDDIRNVFVGKAACPPKPLPVGVGPFEFRADGAYFRAQDVASAYGRYAIAGGKICVTLTDSDRPSFCLAVLKDGEKYLFRFENASPGGAAWAPFPVTPCPLPGGG